MKVCSFELNGEALSKFLVDARSFAAFSGMGMHINKRQYVCAKGLGPIPPGSYFIVDRPSGGLIGPLRDSWNDKSDWLALYADDGSVDDETLCENVKRGAFRLHPNGPLGRSEGCITIHTRPDFYALRAHLQGGGLSPIPGSQLKAYAKVFVR